MTPLLTRERYTRAVKSWLASSGHYLDNPPPGALFCAGARAPEPGLFGDVPGQLVGLCVVGRPVARALPQDGSWGEIVRFVLADGLPHGTASRLLRFAADIATRRGMRRLIAYHDRTRHTGCIYRKAGFRKDGAVAARRVGWGNRSWRVSAGYDAAPKRRWALDLGGTK